MPFHKTVRDWAFGPKKKKKTGAAKRKTLRKRAAAGKGGKIGKSVAKHVSRRRRAIEEAAGN